MEIAPAGVSLSFEVTYDRNDLHVGMSVYDDSGVSPVLVQGPTAMAPVTGNTYRGKFIGTAGKSYIIVKTVYTDNSMLVVNTDYGQGSESIYAQAPSENGGGVATDGIVGFVVPAGVIVGFVDLRNEIIGLVTC